MWRSLRSPSLSLREYRFPLYLLLGLLSASYSLLRFLPAQLVDRACRILRKLLPWRSREGRKRRELTRGDGLQSIFRSCTTLSSERDEKPSLPLCLRELENDNEDSGLNDVQQIAFDLLLASGVIDSSIGLGVLKAILRNVQLLFKTEGDYIFQHGEDHRENLLILKTGACEVLFHNERGDEVVVALIEEQRLLASVVDVVSWIIGHSSSQCHMSVRCTIDCEVIAIPSPHKESIKSPLYVCSYANLVRSLLIRFSRTTITSSLFYLGLAEHTLPRAPALKIPQELQSACPSFEKTAKNHSDHIFLIKKILADLLGASINDILLPLSHSGIQKKPLSAGLGLAPIEGKRLRNGSVGRNLAGMSTAPPRMMKRAKSVGVHQVYDDSSVDLHDSISNGQSELSYHDNSASCLCFNSDNKEVKTGILHMKTGQSILDVDSIPGCYVVLSGCLRVQFQGLPAKFSGANHSGGNFPYLGRHQATNCTTFEKGDVLGQISLLLGNSSEWYGRCDNNLATPAVLTMTALSDTYLLKVPMMSYEEVVNHNPEIIFNLAHLFVSEIPPILRLFDFCTKWKKFSGGEDIVKRGDAATGKLYIVLFGRVRMMLGTRHNDDNSQHTGVGGEERQHYIMGRGALIGDSQLLTGGSYQHTVKAIRQTMISEVSESLLSFLADSYPSILTHIARNVSDKHQLSQVGSPPSKSFFVLPISSSAPINTFTSTMKKCFMHCSNKVNLVTSNDVRTIFDTILDGLSDHEYILTVGNWLHQIEMDSDIVIYQADSQFSMWNDLCLIRTDEILLLANGADYNEGVHMKRLEKSIFEDAEQIPKTVVLTYINPPSHFKPSGTREWIEARGGISRHAHVRLHVNTKFEYDTMHYSSDCNRLARILTNNAVGVVLGGGGARGISHLGVLQALEESGIPVDIIGGTSIGAFIGGCYAKDNSFVSIFHVVKCWAQISSSYWFYILDLTFPITSYFNGYNFTKCLFDIFREDKIEDFWLNYFCVTTDLTSHRERSHVNGTAYRYIRASMSLTNYLPPLCDKHPQSGANHYLVDGGYVNCVPISVMRQEFGAKTIIAVDVSGNWNLTASYDYGSHLNGMRVLRSKLNPFATELNVPTMADIADQLAFVGAVQQVEKVKDLADLCISPPVQQYSVLEFTAFDQLKNIGLECARQEIGKWLKYLDSEVTSSSRQDGKYSWVNNAKTKLSFSNSQ